jgi:membrane protease YdiL (CAAX protease family)
MRSVRSLKVHEDFTRAAEVEGSSDRSFGFIFAGFLALVAVFPAFHGPMSSIRWWAAVLAASFLALALWWSKSLRPLNRLWSKFGLLLSKIVGPVVLMLIFYAVVTPVGLLMRAFGKDPLRLRRDEETSYWIMRQAPEPAPGSMKDQF